VQHAAVHWGDVATWVASVGTVAAVSTALWQVWSQRRKELRNAFHEQAESISAWYSGDYRIETTSGLVVDGVAINLSNGSLQLVYEVVVFLVFVQGAAPRTGEEWAVEHLAEKRRGAHVVLASVPPGLSSVKVRWTGDSVRQGRFGAEIGFTDRKGTHWIRRATGELIQIPSTAIEHYRLGRPVDYRVPMPVYVDPLPS
jgi:hypothetical protein